MWVQKIPWRRACQPTPVFLPGESHGQWSLAGYGPYGRKSQTRLKQLNVHAHTHTHTHTHHTYTYIWYIGPSLVAQLLKNLPENAGDPGSIPGSGKSPGEEIGFRLQYSWASLVAQTVKNLLAMQETLVQSPDWEDPLEEGMATHQYSNLENCHGQKSLAGYSPWGRRVGHKW